MSGSLYTDISLPPVGESLQYTRHDGAVMKLQILPEGSPFDPVKPPVLTYLPQYKPPVTINSSPPASNVVSDVFDNPVIGGKFTVFVLLYGPAAYHAMHKLCLDLIIATVPVGRMDLRIGSNSLCTESVAYVEQLIAQGIVTKHYKHEDNRGKYPVMREMFYDPELPITTNYLIWFDDDSLCDRDKHWMTTLAEAIVANPSKAMFGARYVMHLRPEQIQFYKTRHWFKGKPFRTNHGVPAANGDKAFFATGGCWALSVKAMVACDIPDISLTHNGGDVCIGEQLYQNGFDLHHWNGQKQYVNTSAAERRGLNEPHFGTGSWQALRSRQQGAK